MNRTKPQRGWARGGAGRMARRCLCGAVLGVVCAPFLCLSAEIHSNGTGGGAWSEPATWHGRSVPAPTDDVVVAMRDLVVFDGRDDEETSSCASLFIDPEGVLTFKTGEGRYTLTVAGSVESYGVIKMDGTASPRSVQHLRVMANAAEQRRIRLLENASLLAYGWKGEALDRPNVRVSSVFTSGESALKPVMITAQGDVMLDLQRAELSDVIVDAVMLDNTGAQANERFNVIGSLFRGVGRVVAQRCDTPSIRKNRFDSGRSSVNAPALSVIQCKLADVRDNQIAGHYTRGIQAEGDVDSSVVGNRVSGAECGIQWQGENAMIQNNTVEACGTGVQMVRSTGVIAGLVSRDVALPVDLSVSTVQLADCHAAEAQTTNALVALDNASVSLLNCDISSDRVRLGATAPTTGPWVETMQYLVVSVTGKRPDGTWVEARTAQVSGGVPKGKADLNVRNSPAPLTSKGLTPLPRSRQPLILRSWRIDAKGALRNAPFYDLMVLAPGAKTGAAPKVLKKQLVEPDDQWFRLVPDSVEQVMEVKLP